MAHGRPFLFNLIVYINDIKRRKHVHFMFPNFWVASYRAVVGISIEMNLEIKVLNEIGPFVFIGPI